MTCTYTKENLPKMESRNRDSNADFGTGFRNAVVSVFKVSLKVTICACTGGTDIIAETQNNIHLVNQSL